MGSFPEGQNSTGVNIIMIFMASINHYKKDFSHKTSIICYFAICCIFFSEFFLAIYMDNKDYSDVFSVSLSPVNYL